MPKQPTEQPRCMISGCELSKADKGVEYLVKCPRKDVYICDKCYDPDYSICGQCHFAEKCKEIVL